MKKCGRVPKTERGGLMLLCEAVIYKALSDYLFEKTAVWKDDARMFLLGGYDFEFYAQLSGEVCLDRAKYARKCILNGEPIDANRIFPCESTKQKTNKEEFEKRKQLWAWQNKILVENCAYMTAAELSLIVGMQPSAIQARLYYKGLKCKRAERKK